LTDYAAYSVQSQPSPENFLLLERAIVEGEIDHARDLLREILLSMAPIGQGSIGDALQEIAARNPNRSAAILVLRALDVVGLVPHARHNAAHCHRGEIAICIARAAADMGFPTVAVTCEDDAASRTCVRRTRCLR
jgi:hypothetical protein